MNKCIDCTNARRVCNEEERYQYVGCTVMSDKPDLRDVRRIPLWEGYMYPRLPDQAVGAEIPFSTAKCRGIIVRASDSCKHYATKEGN